MRAPQITRDCAVKVLRAPAARTVSKVVMQGDMHCELGLSPQVIRAHPYHVLAQMMTKFSVNLSATFGNIAAICWEICHVIFVSRGLCRPQRHQTCSDRTRHSPFFRSRLRIGRARALGIARFGLVSGCRFDQDGSDSDLVHYFCGVHFLAKELIAGLRQVNLSILRGLRRLPIWETRQHENYSLEIVFVNAHEMLNTKRLFLSCAWSLYGNANRLE